MSRLGARWLAAGVAVALLAWAYGRWTRDKGDALPAPPTPAQVVAAARTMRAPVDVAGERAELERRIAFLHRRAEQRGDDWISLEELAACYRARARLTGDYEDYARAAEALKRAFARAPAGAGPHLEQARLDLALHRIDAARRDLAAIGRYRIADEAAQATLLGLTADTLFYTGHYAEARRGYEASRAAGGGMAAAVRLADASDRAGDPAGSMRLLAEAERKLRGPQPAARSFLAMTRGLIALRRGAWDEAEAHLLRADALYGGQWQVEMYLAALTALKGKPEPALRRFEALARRTGVPEAMDAAAALYRAKGDRLRSRARADEAQAVWARRLALFPEAAYAHALEHELAFGDPRRALELARRNRAARPFGESAVGLAWALLANRRPAEALAALEGAAGWNSADRHAVAAEAYALLGRGSLAAAERRAALARNHRRLDPNLPPMLLED